MSWVEDIICARTDEPVLVQIQRREPARRGTVTRVDLHNIVVTVATDEGFYEVLPYHVTPRDMPQHMCGLMSAGKRLNRFAWLLRREIDCWLRQSASIPPLEWLLGLPWLTRRDRGNSSRRGD